MGSTSKPCYERRSVDDPARGTRLFDTGEFFEAHEVWEGQWRVATDQVERDFLQGLIQVAAAFHKLLVMKSADAALSLLAKGLAKLDACPAHVKKMDLASFRERLRACARDLAAGRFARAAIPTMGTCHDPEPLA
jgi:predicted metal-dependent hydrolase